MITLTELKQKVISQLLEEGQVILNPAEYAKLKRAETSLKSLTNYINVLEEQLAKLSEGNQMPDLGIDFSKVTSINDLRKLVYKETPTTTKLKELELEYKGPITKEAGITELNAGNYMVAAFIARKLEDSNKKAKSNKNDKRNKSTKSKLG